MAGKSKEDVSDASDGSSKAIGVLAHELADYWLANQK